MINYIHLFILIFTILIGILQILSIILRQISKIRKDKRIYTLDIRFKHDKPSLN